MDRLDDRPGAGGHVPGEGFQCAVAASSTDRHGMDRGTPREGGQAAERVACIRVIRSDRAGAGGVVDGVEQVCLRRFDRLEPEDGDTWLDAEAVRRMV